MLDARGVTVVEDRNSRKEPLSDAEAQALLSAVDEVRVARGKKIHQVAAAEASLDDLKGPTGNYRAPIIRCGQSLLVGYHPDTLQQLLEM